MPPGAWPRSGLQEPSREAPTTLPELPGAETKLIATFRESSRDNFQRDFTPPSGAGEAALASILLLAIGVEITKISNFANSLHENLDFQGSEGLSGSIFGAKNRSGNELEAKSAHTHVPGP